MIVGHVISTTPELQTLLDGQRLLRSGLSGVVHEPVEPVMLNRLSALCRTMVLCMSRSSASCSLQPVMLDWLSEAATRTAERLVPHNGITGGITSMTTIP